MAVVYLYREADSCAHRMQYRRNLLTPLSSLTCHRGHVTFALSPLSAGLKDSVARKILLADDSVTAQNMGRRILTDAGYHVTTVNNGSAALKRISEAKPDLIVLDVYMPGYGGLEVCQRLRESPDTARIPVLLTVGKLEPFKADDARRVRADAFIVKPFEASELLTALTKLEDKIVPQAQPAKPGRAAKAWKATDDFASGKDFGNSETGWKNRLSIPPPHAKHHEPEAEEAPIAQSGSHEEVVVDEPKQPELKSGLEEALLSSLPHDVTPEEIAAIKAAAAAFSAPVAESYPTTQPAVDQVAESAEHSEEKLAGQPEESAVSAGDRESAAALASGATPGLEAEPQKTAAADENSEATTEPETVAATSGVQSQVAEPAASTIPDSADEAALPNVAPEADDEVTAALASLAPAKPNADSPAFDRGWEMAASDRGSITMAAAVAAQDFSGSRWIAEAVTVMEDEATLALEQEMERAYAGFAAADAARMGSATPAHEESWSKDEAPATIAEMNPSSPEPSPSDAQALPIETQAQISEQSEEPAYTESHAAREAAQPDAPESSAFAAAASASASMVEPTVVEAASQSTPESLDRSAPSAEPEEPRGGADLDAAWANWQHIRESVVGSEIGAQIADKVAELQSADTEVKADAQPDSPSASGEDSEEIADIVDTVLADLKPKLMQEIAKKMGKSSKRKKHKE